MTRSPRTAIIIGAGLGGLATSIRLAAAGWQVTIFEKSDRAGGRCNQWCSSGYTFDTGPTLLLMRDVLDELFAVAGTSTSEHLDLLRLHPNYRVRFGDGSSIELSSDLDTMGADLERIEPGASRSLRAFLDDAGYKYRVSRARFVERNFRHWYEFATPANLYFLLRTHTLRKLDRHARRYFRDERIITALTFQAMYLGISPAAAPSVYSLLPYTELTEGIWFPRGGMYRIVQALEHIARGKGVRICYGQEVARVLVANGRASGVALREGEHVGADVVVSNADLPYTYQMLLPNAHTRRFLGRRLDRLNYGSSAFLLYLGLDQTYPQLGHHNVFLSSDTARNFRDIFRDGALPTDPSFYVCVASRTDPSLAPPDRDGMYVLVPVPALSPRIEWEVEKSAFRERVLDRLEAVGLADLRRHICVERVYAPTDFETDYHVTRGSAFGLSHGFWQVGYLRPGNRARRPTNMYFVGASTVPGGGVPMVLLSSRLTTERILENGKRG